MESNGNKGSGRSGAKKSVGRWHGHKFTVSSKKVMSFIGLQLKGSSETEDLIKGTEKFVKYKNAKPKEVSFTIKLNAFLGCDVKKEAKALVKESEQGIMDYLYIGRRKVMSCKLMLTEASVKEMAFSAGMKWLWADVAVTFKQSSTNDGSTDGKSTSSSGGSSGGGGKKSGGGSGGGGSRYPADDERKKQMQEAKVRAQPDAEERRQAAEREPYRGPGPAPTPAPGNGGKYVRMER